jgi:hypothetical protein
MVYANDLLARKGSYLGYNSFRVNEDAMYYPITNQEWNTSQILRINSNTEIDTLHFGINKNWEGEPSFTSDGKWSFLFHLMASISSAPGGDRGIRKTSKIYWVDIAALKDLKRNN